MNRSLVVVAALFVLSRPAFAQAPIPERPPGWIADEAKLLTQDERARLESLSEDIAKKHDLRLAVLTLADAKGESSRDIAIRALNAWAPGPRSALLLVVMNPRKLYVQPGKEFASRLGDAACSSICGGAIAPHMKAGKPAAAIQAGLEAHDEAIVALPAEAPEPAPPAPSPPSASPAVTPVTSPGLPLPCLAIPAGLLALMVLLLRLVRVKCPRCGKTMSRSHRTITPATYSSAGQGE